MKADPDDVFQNVPPSIPGASDEEWRPVAESGTVGLWVSSYGRVACGDHLIPASLNTGGYERVAIYVRGEQRDRQVHRLVAEAFIGPQLATMTVNHRDGNKRNNRSGNLEYLSRADNIRHARRLGLYDAQTEWAKKPRKCGVPCGVENGSLGRIAEDDGR